MILIMCKVNHNSKLRNSIFISRIDVRSKGGTYETVMVDNVYKVITKLIIIPMKPSDFGAYKCVAKNSVGQAEKFIYLYRKFPYF